MGTRGAWSSSTASEVGLGTGARAGARSGTGLGSTLVEDGDSPLLPKGERQAGNKTEAGAETAATEEYMGKSTAEAGAVTEQQMHGSPGPGQEPR